MKLNLGCGRKPMPGYVNVDRVKLDGVDVVADLDWAPWPFADHSITEIQAWHVFEHVTDPCLFMAEAWRVLERGGRLVIVVPYFTHVSAFTDPTHRRVCTPWTWDYWVRGSMYRDADIYGEAEFEKLATGSDRAETILKVDLAALR